MRAHFSRLSLLAQLVCILAASQVLGCASSDPDQPGSSSEVGSVQSALGDDQCSFFDVDGSVQICHHTSSATHPFTIIKTSVQGCINGHADHAQDYIAVGDPTCQGGGCLPETAPCDATVPCCDGLTCQDGTCVAPPTCPCSGSPVWDTAVSSTKIACTNPDPSTFAFSWINGSFSVGVGGVGTAQAACGAIDIGHSTSVLITGLSADELSACLADATAIPCP